MESRLVVNLDKLANTVNIAIVGGIFVFFALGTYFSFYFHFVTVFLIMLTLLNIFYLYVQRHHTLLSNYGILAQFRYLTESIGPELRQYLFASDTEERPFSRIERSELYRKSKDIDSSSSFGTLKDFNLGRVQLRHSLFPVPTAEVQPFSVTFGETRQMTRPFTICHPMMISGMSYGALSKRAVRALSRGAKLAGIPVCTGEGGYPKYHLMEGANIIFQIGTAKFGVRKDDGSLDPEKLRALTQHPEIRMIELKLSQGAKPGKGGLLPKEKITDEIAQLRGVSQDEDVHSPPSHPEARSPELLAQFVKDIQEISGLPVGVKLCIGKESDFISLVAAFRSLGRFPDYFAIDGAEGGTGAAPKSFMDDLGIPIFQALPFVHHTLIDQGVRDQVKIVAAGKLVTPGRQVKALCLGADAIYSARAFMFALGCVQALQCNTNNCPAGIATHNKHLERGLDIQTKAIRVQNLVRNMEKELREICAALGHRSFDELSEAEIFCKEAAIGLAKREPRA